MRRLLLLALMPVAEGLVQVVAVADALAVLPAHSPPQPPGTAPV